MTSSPSSALPYALEFFSDVEYNLGRLKRRDTVKDSKYSVDASRFYNAMLKYGYVPERTAMQFLREMGKCEECEWECE